MLKIALVELNALRTAQGMKPLKAWKDSKDKLTAAIDKLRASSSTTQQLKASVEIAKPVNGTKSHTVKEINKDKSGSIALDQDVVSIQTIADELNMGHKIARNKLRRQENVPCIEGSRWKFYKSDVPAIKAMLKGDSRKK